MRSFRLSIITMLVFLTIVFNIERLDIGEENLINIQTFVYVLVLAVVVATMAIPALRKAHIGVSYALWLAVYAVLKFVTNNGQNRILGGIYTYLTITEITVLMLTVALVMQLASQVDDVETTVRNILFADKSQRVLLLEEAENDIKREMYRSRRLQQPLSIAVIEPSSGTEDVAMTRTIREVQQMLKQHYLAISMARGLDKMLRRTDLLLEQSPKGRIVILSPETSSEGATSLVDRVRQALHDQYRVKVNSAIAAFPEDALTFDELISHAESQLEGEVAVPALEAV
jgi:hypothetical protein